MTLNYSLEQPIFYIGIGSSPWAFLGKGTTLPTFQGIAHIQMLIVLEATIDTAITQDPILAIQIGRWSTISISRDIRLCHF